MRLELLSLAQPFIYIPTFTLCVCMSSGQNFGLTFILLSNFVYGMKNNVDPDQLASEEAS